MSAEHVLRDFSGHEDEEVSVESGGEDVTIIVTECQRRHIAVVVVVRPARPVDIQTMAELFLVRQQIDSDRSVLKADHRFLSV